MVLVPYYLRHASNTSHRVILSDCRAKDQELSISDTVSYNDKILLLEKSLNFSEMLGGVDEKCLTGTPSFSHAHRNREKIC